MRGLSTRQCRVRMISPAMVINASMKMTTTALMVALSRANAANSVKYLG